MSNLQNGLTIKQNFIGLAVIAGLFIAALVWTQQPTAEAKEGYQPKSPAVQAEYDAFNLRVDQERCAFIKRLATTKLEDDMNGVPMDIDRNDLASKRDSNCSF